jgi:hypothetical protein
MAVTGISRPQVAVPTQPTDVAAPKPAVDPSAPAAAGWGPRAGGPTPAAPSRLAGLEQKVEGKAVALVLDNASKSHDVGTSFGLGVAQGNVKLSEEIGLKNTDAHQTLVDGDRRRADYEKRSPDAVWVKTSALAGASAGFPLGAGASVGLSGNLAVTSIAAQHVGQASDVAGAVAAQGKSLVLPLDADGLQGLNPAPGTEWMFRGQASVSAGIGEGTGTSATVGAGTVTAQVNANVGLSAQANATFTKNVKVLDDHQVYVQVGQVTAESAGLSLGATAGVSLNAAGTVSDVVGGGQVGSQVGKLADQAGNQVENKTRVTAAASGSLAAGQKVMGAAVLDLNTVAGREAYNHILRSTPQEAASFIAQQGLGVRYDETSRARNSSASLQFGSTNLLSTSTVRNTTQGLVQDAGNTTQLSQVDYNRSVSGLLPRLALGEERNVSVRGGAVTKGGVTQNAIAVTLAVKDPKVTDTEVAQFGRFAAAMGQSVSGLPQVAAGGNVGEGGYQVQVALTDAQVKKLGAWDDDSMRLAFASAQREISGNAALPAWYSQPQAFTRFKNQYTMANGGSGHGPSQASISAEYRKQFGTDLQQDIASESAITDIAKQIDGARGKPAGDWGKVLEAVGQQASPDVRAAMLALRKLAGAEVVDLSLTAQGKTVAAQPETTAPSTLSDLVGPLLAPPA